MNAKGKFLDIDVDPRFGGSAGFVLFDTDTGRTGYLGNSVHRNLTQLINLKQRRLYFLLG